MSLKFLAKEKLGGVNMGTIDISRQLAKYIFENNLSLQDIQNATDIPVSKLVEGGQRLSAIEMLELCYYLNIRPESLV